MSFCELRLPTLARSCGFRLSELAREKCANLSFDPQYVRLEDASPVYHPVKHLVALDWET